MTSNGKGVVDEYQYEGVKVKETEVALEGAGWRAAS